MVALPTGYRGIAPDQRGFGEAELEKKIDATNGMGDLADDAVALLDYLSIDMAHIVGNSLGGMIVDSGEFPWGKYPERFHMLTQPEESYHGVVYTEAMGAAAYIGRVRTVALRNTGAALSPMNAFLILQGLETLSLRMERHFANAQKVAEYLDAHDQVEPVDPVGLELRLEDPTVGSPVDQHREAVAEDESGVALADIQEHDRRTIDLGTKRDHGAGQHHRQPGKGHLDPQRRQGRGR